MTTSGAPPSQLKKAYKMACNEASRLQKTLMLDLPLESMVTSKVVDQLDNDKIGYSFTYAPSPEDNLKAKSVLLRHVLFGNDSHSTQSIQHQSLLQNL